MADKVDYIALSSFMTAYGRYASAIYNRTDGARTIYPYWMKYIAVMMRRNTCMHGLFCPGRNTCAHLHSSLLFWHRQLQHDQNLSVFLFPILFPLGRQSPWLAGQPIRQRKMPAIFDKLENSSERLPDDSGQILNLYKVECASFNAGSWQPFIATFVAHSSTRGLPRVDKVAFNAFSKLIFL
jgi:hypothetical protein